MRCQITLNTTLSICSCLNADLNRWSFVLCRQRGLQGKTVLTASLLPAETGTDTICPRAAAAAALPALFLFRLGLKIISRLGSMWACVHMFLLTLRAAGVQWQVNRSESTKSDWKKLAGKGEKNHEWGPEGVDCCTTFRSSNASGSEHLALLLCSILKLPVGWAHDRCL